MGAAAPDPTPLGDVFSLSLTSVPQETILLHIVISWASIFPEMEKQSTWSQKALSYVTSSKLFHISEPVSQSEEGLVRMQARGLLRGLLVPGVRVELLSPQTSVR